MASETETSRVEDLHLLSACCKFYHGQFINPKLVESYKGGSHRKLAKRIEIYLNRKKDAKEGWIAEVQSKLSPCSIEDQLCIASLHFYKNQFQEAIDIYKKILLEMKHYLALNVYIALCYYKLDYYDVSQEVLTLYLQKHPKSIVAGNLKACNSYRLYNGTTAEVR